MERPKCMWEVMNVIHPLKDATKLLTEGELKTATLRRQQEVGDLMVFTNSRISDVFPPKK